MLEAARAALGRWIPAPWGERLLALICLAVVGALQWWAAHLNSGPFSEQLSVPAHSEVVTFSSPKSSDNGLFSFGYTPESLKPRVWVEGYFDNSTLSPKTVQKFQMFNISAPTTHDVVSYLTTGGGNSACATQVTVTPEAGSPASVSLSQSADDPAYGYRSIGVMFIGTDSTVTLTSLGGGVGLSNCKVDLRVGQWEQTTQGDFPVEIQVPAGSQFRLHWHDLGDEITDRNRLLAFGSNATDAFTAQSVSVATVGNDGQKAGTPKLQAQASKGGTVTVEAFRINSNQLEMKVDGNGVLTKDGKVISNTNLLSAITTYPLLAAMFGALNVALINWVRRTFTPARQQPTASNSANA